MADLPRAAVYQGRPCKRGHGGLRYASTKACIECAKSAARTQKVRGKLLAGETGRRA